MSNRQLAPRGLETVLIGCLPQGATPHSARFGSFNPGKERCGTSNHGSFTCRCPGLFLLHTRPLHRGLFATRICGGGWAFPTDPLTNPRSSRHRTRMRLFGITRWSYSFPDDEVGCSREFEAGRVTFAGGVLYSMTGVLVCVSHPPAC